MQLFLSALMSSTTGCDLCQICPTQTHCTTRARTPTQTACHMSIQARFTMHLEELLLWKRFYIRASMLQRKRVFSITSYWLVFSALCCDVSSSLKMCWHIRACGLLLSHDSISRLEACQKLVIFHLQRGRDWDQSPLVVDVGANVSFIFALTRIAVIATQYST